MRLQHFSFNKNLLQKIWDKKKSTNKFWVQKTVGPKIWIWGYDKNFTFLKVFDYDIHEAEHFRPKPYFDEQFLSSKIEGGGGVEFAQYLM